VTTLVMFLKFPIPRRSTRTSHFLGVKIQSPGALRALNEIEVLNKLRSTYLAVLYLLPNRTVKRASSYK
jgi:hypothetical protein